MPVGTNGSFDHTQDAGYNGNGNVRPFNGAPAQPQNDTQPPPSPSLRTQPPVPLDSIRAIKALVAAEGNARLAAMAIGATDSAIIAAIVTDDTSQEVISRYIRTYTMLKNFELINTCAAELHDQIDSNKVDAKELTRLMGSLIDTMSRLTDVRQTALGTGSERLGTEVLNMLPAPARAAVVKLMGQPADTTGAVVSDNDVQVPVDEAG